MSNYQPGDRAVRHRNDALPEGELWDSIKILR
jgi:hypothetical protein